MNTILDLVFLLLIFSTVSVLQEKIVKPTDAKPFVNYLFLTFSSNIFSCIVGYFLLRYQNIEIKTSKHFLLAVVKISSLNFIGQQLAYCSLKYVSFPLLMLIKSSKLAPVFLISFFYEKTKSQKKLALILIALGITIFTGFKEKSSSKIIDENYQAVGIVLLLVSIFLDGMSKVLKEKIFNNITISSEELMFYNSAFLTSFSAVFMFPPFSKQLFCTVNYYYYFPKKFETITKFSLFYSLSQVFVFRFIKRYGIVNLVLANLIRKMFSILLSLFLFHKGLNKKQVLGIIIVFVGILCEFAE
ncbi:UDP-galactose transporter like protein 1 [Cucumispora dikerogammari]|nr:UDP-galactose transporter like protein 1 [Cucumispora dikerogammari]